MRYPTVPFKTGLSICVAIGLFITSVMTPPIGAAQAREGNRTLKLYFGHTKERGEFTFKRNGRYDKAELKRINRFLRDWRRNEDANLDPKLLDLVWSIYREAGGRDYIHVVSAYRSLKTNNLLRSRSKGVAEKSQHTAGKAMDFYIPGVPLAKLRATAMKFQGGGVGYYPTSGSPFVHVDTGSVRSWPRMTRSQLLALFPNGETLYLPADGKPLPGYQRAMAKRKSGGETALAYLQSGPDETGRKGKGNVAGWLKRVFDGGADEAEDNEVSGTAVAAAPVAPPPAPPPAEQPAGSDPQVLIAAAEEAKRDSRLPKARPQTGPDMMQAAMSPDLPPNSSVAPEDTRALASLAFAPLPRSRPDSALLAESLDKAEGPAPLAVGAEDAIAALAAQAEQPLLAMTGQRPAEVQLPAPAPRPTSPSSAADGARTSDHAASGAPAPVPLERGPGALDAANALAAPPAAAPAPPPVALAFAGTGLRSGEASIPTASAAGDTGAPAIKVERAVLAPPEAEIEAPVVLKGDRIQLAALSAGTPDTAAVTVPVNRTETAVQRTDEEGVRELVNEPVEKQFSGFALPEPAGAAGLFTAPETASEITAQSATPKLPTLRFYQAKPADAPAAEESFLSRLFASLSQ